MSQRFPPNLDVLLEAPAGVLAIESKLIEYIAPAGPAIIERGYDRAIDELADETWRQRIRQIRASPTEFQHLRASQIVKHYLGLRSCFAETHVRLIYLAWEPLDHASHRLFEQHRAELEGFATTVRDPHLSFELRTYRELFREWGERLTRWATS